MREIKFKMERPNLVKIGDQVEVSEIQTNRNFSYIIEPAVAMSGCYKNADRLKARNGVITNIEHTPRGYMVTAEFEED